MERLMFPQLAEQGWSSASQLVPTSAIVKAQEAVQECLAQGRFRRPPAEVLDGLLGTVGSSQIAEIQAAEEPAGFDQADRVLTQAAGRVPRVGSLQGRTHAVVHQVRQEPGSEGSVAYVGQTPTQLIRFCSRARRLGLASSVKDDSHNASEHTSHDCHDEGQHQSDVDDQDGSNSWYETTWMISFTTDDDDDDMTSERTGAMAMMGVTVLLSLWLLMLMKKKMRTTTRMTMFIITNVMLMTFYITTLIEIMRVTRNIILQLLLPLLLLLLLLGLSGLCHL
ncbi:unnamed protein product [Symbiodinium sp. CCMP2592]|nr:unnamed protein product [Symbiodinium sp. CCMP2592]